MNTQSKKLHSYSLSETHLKPALKSKLTDILIGFVSLIPSIIYQALYFRSYFPITEGWFSAYASLISSGKIPYIDFFFLLPPLYPIHIALLQYFFGESLFVLRLFGFLVTLIIGGFLFSILKQFFNKWIAAFAAAVGLIYYQSGNAYIGYDFTQILTLYALAALYFSLKYLENVSFVEQERNMQQAKKFIFLAGFFLAGAALIKQSNGGFVSLGITLWLILFLARSQRPRIAVIDIIYFVLGAAVPTALTVLWLTSHGAASAFLNQVIFDALAAKGGGHAILTGWTSLLFGPGGFSKATYMLGFNLAVLCGITAISSITIIASINVVANRHHPVDNRTANKISVFKFSEKWCDLSTLLVCAIGLALLSLVIVYIYLCSPLWSSGWNSVLVFLIVKLYDNVKLASFYTYILMLLIYLLTFLFNPNKLNSKWFLLFSFCFILTIGNGTSAGLSEISAFLGFAIIVSCLITISAPAMVPSLIPIGLCLLWSAFLIEEKFEMPYSWWSVISGDVRKVNCANSTGVLRYICVDPVKYSKIQRVVDAIDNNSAKSDPIFVFPHEPIFYLLSERSPFGKAVVSWFDFISADQGKLLINSLTRDPPRVMIISRLPTSVFNAHEQLFNGGKLGVQREIMSIIDNGSRSGKLKLVETQEIDGISLEIYVRSDSVFDFK